MTSTSTPAAAEDAKAQESALVRMRIGASGLLLLMTVLLVFARTMAPSGVAWAYAAAFAEAAMIGGLADWYAVTALFRHPLGIKMPHTAIIPNNKERIGESVGKFLQHNFMTQQVVQLELSKVDFAGAAADWLARSVNSDAVATHLTRALPSLLRRADDDRLRDIMRMTLTDAFSGARLAPALAKILDLLVAGRQHHVLLEHILGLVARALEQNRPYIRAKVHESSPRWLPKAIDEKLFERLLEGVQAMLIEIQSEQSEWRVRYDQAARDMIEKLACSPAYESKLHELVARCVEHPAVRTYCADVWRALKEHIMADCTSDTSRIGAHSAAAMRALGAALQADEETRKRINQWLREVVTDTIVERRDMIAAIAWRVIRSWDAQTVSRKFELQVGKDLQFIRINGTIVGGSIGVLLHAATSWMPW
jgi:uncharacterized membrane-anchored protein YjiN (DUF445 family)